MKDAVYPYVIVNAAGAIVCQTPAACRYPRYIEKSLQDSGYTIYLNGKKITNRQHKAMRLAAWAGMPCGYASQNHRIKMPCAMCWSVPLAEAVNTSTTRTETRAAFAASADRLSTGSGSKQRFDF